MDSEKDQAYNKLENAALEANKDNYSSTADFQRRGNKAYQVVNANISDEDIKKTARGYAIDAIEEWEETHKEDKLEQKRLKYNKAHPGEEKSPEEYTEYLENTRIHKIDQAFSKIPVLNLGWALAKGIAKTPSTIKHTIDHGVQLNRYNKTAEEAIRKTGNLSAASAAIEKINNADKFDKASILEEITPENLDNSTSQAITERVQNANEFSRNEDAGVTNIQKSEGKNFNEVRNEDENNLTADEQIRKIFGEYATDVAKKKATKRNRQAVLEEIEKINEQNPNAPTINNYKEIIEQINTDIGGALQYELGKKRDAETKEGAIKAIDEYLDNHVSILSANVETGLAAKETYAKIRDKATLKYGLMAGAAVSIGAGLLGFSKSTAAQAAVGPGLGATAIKAGVAGVLGAIGAGMAESHRQGRENIKDALTGETVENEESKGKYKIYGFNDLVNWMDENVDKETGKIVEIEGEDRFEYAAELIAKYRTLNRLQNEKGIQLIGFGPRDEMEKNKATFFKSLNNLKQAMINSKGDDITKNAIEGQMENSDIIDGIIENTENTEKAQKHSRRMAAIKGGVIAAGVSGVISLALHHDDIMNDAKSIPIIGGIFGGEEIADNLDGEISENNIKNIKGKELITQSDGTIDLVDEKGQSVVEDIEIDDKTGHPTDESLKKISEKLNLDSDKLQVTENTEIPPAGNLIKEVNLSEYLNNPENQDVINYSSISFDSTHGTTIGEPVSYDDGYHIPISNAPEDSKFIIGLEDGKALSAEIKTDANGESYALLPTDSVIFNTVQSDDITGDWFSVGAEENGTFTSYASMQCNGPFEGEVLTKSSESIEPVSSYNLEYDNEIICAYDIPNKELGPIEFSDGDTANLELVRGGYNPTEDPFLSSEGANFGKPIEADTPESALSEWITNIQKSPDQLVWNSMAMSGFEESQEVESFFTENFGEDWRTEFNIESEIDTEKEINVVANKIAEKPEVYEDYKELFLQKFTEKVENGSVEAEEIGTSGRYTNLHQSNQYVDGESDITKSIIRAAKSNTGGTGLVIQDATGNSIFDESKMSKMLNIPDGQKVSDTMIRLNCGGQTTKVIESYSDTPGTGSNSEPTPGPNPEPTPEPEPTPTPSPEPPTTEPPTTEPPTTEPPTTEPPTTEPPTTEPPTTEPPTTVPPTTLAPKNPDEEIKNAGPGVEQEDVKTPASEKSHSEHEVDGGNIGEHTIETPESQARNEQAAADEAAAEQAAKEGDAITQKVENATTKEEVNQIGADLYKQHQEGQQ